MIPISHEMRREMAGPQAVKAQHLIKQSAGRGKTSHIALYHTVLIYKLYTKYAHLLILRILKKKKRFRKVVREEPDIGI